MRRTMISLGLIVLALVLGFTPMVRAQDLVLTTFDVPFTPGFSPVETEANGINVLGQIVGDYADSQANIEHGYLRDPDGSFTPIDVQGAFRTRAVGINATGTIVGQYQSGFGPAGLHCFILTAGVFTTLDVDVQQIPNAFNTGCRGINNPGQIVGRFRDSITRLRHGFLFSNGAFTQIDFPGAVETIARKINNRGQIVGGYSTDPAVDRFHGFMRDESGNFTKIDFPGSIETFAADINDQGVIVGQYADSCNIVHGFLLSGGVYVTVPVPGVPQNLGSFTTDSANFTIGLSGISDNGMITGVSMTADGNFHGFLLTGVQGFRPTSVPAPPCASGLYAAVGGFTPSILVYAPDANDNVAPIRTISGPNTGLANTVGIALDSAGNLYVADNAFFPSITVYAPGANDNVAPIRTISGPNTGLANTTGIALDSAGNLYVANNVFFPSITVYAPGANGNVTPIRTISGPNTGLGNTVGIALDSAGNLFVANGVFFPSITVYAPGANGNVAPIRTIAGSNTGLASGVGLIAVL